MNLIRGIQNGLEQRNVYVSSDWLSQCIEFLRDHSNVSEERLGELVFQQFVNSNLKEVGIGSLPTKVSQFHNKVLAGSFILQVEEVLNIGEPTHRVEATKDEPDTFGNAQNRMLKLLLTDGKQMIRVSDLLVRRGILMLTSDAVQILGGTKITQQTPLKTEKPLDNGIVTKSNLQTQQMDVPIHDFDRDFDQDFDDEEALETKSAYERSVQQNPIPVDDFDYNPLDFVDMDNVDLPSVKKEEEEEESPKRSSFTTIKEVKKNYKNMNEVTIKGIVKDTIPPLLFGNKFSLRVDLQDETGSLTAELSDIFISSLIGFSCSEFKSNMKNELGKIMNTKGLKKMESVLVDMEGIMDLSFPIIVDPKTKMETKSPVPLVLNIRPIESEMEDF